MLYEKGSVGEKIYLIGVFEEKLPYIATLEFPNLKTTIEEYRKWERDHVKNAICLGDVFTPQTLPHSSIRDFISLNTIFEEACEDNEVTPDDFLIPFLGGVHNCDFRVLLKKLYEQESNFWTMRCAIKEYYNELASDRKEELI